VAILARHNFPVLKGVIMKLEITAVVITITSSRRTLRCVPALLCYGYPLILQKNPEAKCMRDQQ
jgi:hypothetical protein